MPEGLLLILPEPVPGFDTVSAKARTLITSKLAVTVVFSVKDDVHSSVPLHPPPLQPENIDPRLAVAVKVTGVPSG
jgi:hypothetical protein